MTTAAAGGERHEPSISRLCQSLAEASPMPMVAVVGPSHVVRYANPAFRRLVNRLEEDLAGNQFPELTPDREECSLLLDRVLRTGEPEIHNGERRSAVHPLSWSYAVWPLTAPENGVVGILIQVTETTPFREQVIAMNEALLIGSIRQHESAETAKALNVQLQTENEARARAEEELRRANADLDQFALAVSHDLQEPLRMVVSFSELLRKGYQAHLTGAGLEYLDFITTGALKMRLLLKDLLTYARAGKDTGDAAELIHLDEVLQHTLQNLELAIGDTGAVVTCEALPAVYGHATLFLQIFQNLIGNAIKYRGERPLSVRVSAERLNDEWRFAVADNGMGIDPKYHQQIFGVFKRLHREAIPGTGIGLAICQRIVERYGGRIWVESEVGQGATFYFTLPVAEA